MKLIHNRYRFGVFLLLASLLWQGCCKSDLHFSGKVVDKSGTGIPNAVVKVGDEERKTDKNGEFKICVVRAERYVLNVSETNFGFVSKIYPDTASGLTITMTKATVSEFDANQPIKLEDSAPVLTTPLSSDLGTISSPLDTIPFVYDGQGKLIAFKAPPMISDTYDAAQQFAEPTTGAVIEVPAGALFDPSQGEGEGQGRIEGKITGSISTIDIYSPDGMPGDNTVEFKDGSTGFMETYGAADVSFFSGGKELQLRKGQSATLTIPVDAITRAYYGNDLPQTMPLLVYDKVSGKWKRDGDKVGTLNTEKTGYVAQITHFSVFNMDEEFGTPTCYKMCATGIPSTAKLEVSVPGHIKPFLPFGTGCTDACTSGGVPYAIIYMKPNTPIGIRISDGTTNVIKSSYVFIAGGASTPHETACDITAPLNSYGGCSGPVAINFAPPTYMNANGTMNTPIIAIKLVGTNIVASWVFISGPPPTYTNAATTYYIEWSDDDFTTTDSQGLSGTDALPKWISSAGNTKWHDLINIPVNAMNFPGSPTLQYKFRIRVGLPSLGGPFNDSGDCYTQSGGIATCI